MSMEQAILELAGAMREQAAAQREANEVNRATNAGYERAVTAYATGGSAFHYAVGIPGGIPLETSSDDIVTIRAPVEQKAADLAEARAERVTEAKVSAKVDAAQNAKESSVARQAIQQALDAAKAGAKAKQDKADDVKPDAELEAAVSKVEADAKPLDYKADVQPRLLALIKAKGKPVVVDLVDGYGVKTAADIPPAEFKALLVKVEALLAE